MRIRTVVSALLVISILTAAVYAEPLDPKRYMPVSELRPGMTGIGRTTLKGSEIVEFQVTIEAILKNNGPKQDLIIVRCSGAGLEESGIIAGMSGSPIYINGRLIGALAYAFGWCKVPIAGVQPIEQMLEVTDEHPWVKQEAAVASSPSSPSIRVPASAVRATDLAAVSAGAPGAFDLTPVRIPLVVSGVAPQVMEKLRTDLAPFGLEPMQGGAVARNVPVLAKLEPGAPLAIPLVRGDIEMAGMGTITEIVGDRLYGFGHPMFGSGEADYPLMTGIGHVVIPTYPRSFRLGAPVEEVGRLSWDASTAVFGRLTKDRSRMVPVTVTVRGPDAGAEQTYHCEVVHHRMISSRLAAIVALNSLYVHSDLPYEYTLTYRLRIKPVGREPLVYDNVCASPYGSMTFAMQLRSVVGDLMENNFENLAMESVEVEVQVEPRSREAEIEGVRALRRAVRPGETVPVEVKIRPWRQEPTWVRFDVQVPRDYPNGSYHVSFCGGDEALSQQMSESPARFDPKSLDGLVRMISMDNRRDQLYVRLQAPGQGIAVGETELPNLPGSMRAVLAGAARQQVSDVRESLVVTHPMPYVLVGETGLDFTVDEHAAE